MTTRYSYKLHCAVSTTEDMRLKPVCHVWFVLSVQSRGGHVGGQPEVAGASLTDGGETLINPAVVSQATLVSRC